MPGLDLQTPGYRQAAEEPAEPPEKQPDGVAHQDRLEDVLDTADDDHDLLFVKNAILKGRYRYFHTHFY